MNINTFFSTIRKKTETYEIPDNGENNISAINQDTPIALGELKNDNNVEALVISLPEILEMKIEA